MSHELVRTKSKINTHSKIFVFVRRLPNTELARFLAQTLKIRLKNLPAKFKIFEFEFRNGSSICKVKSTINNLFD